MIRFLFLSVFCYYASAMAVSFQDFTKTYSIQACEQRFNNALVISDGVCDIRPYHELQISGSDASFKIEFRGEPGASVVFDLVKSQTIGEEISEYTYFGDASNAAEWFHVIMKKGSVLLWKRTGLDVYQNAQGETFLLIVNELFNDPVQSTLTDRTTQIFKLK